MTASNPKSAAELALEAARRTAPVAEAVREQASKALEAAERHRGALDAAGAHTDIIKRVQAAMSSDALQAALETVRKSAPLVEPTETLHNYLLTLEGLSAVDNLRGTIEMLESPLRLGDLQKRAIAKRSPPADTSPSRVVSAQGSFASTTQVRPATRDETAPLPAPTPATQSAPIASAADIGRVLREAREKRGLSQQKLADMAHVGRRFLSELENGKPSLAFEKVLDVARALNVDLFARPRA